MPRTPTLRIWLHPSPIPPIDWQSCRCPSPHQCLAFVGIEFPLSATCLGRESSHILQSDLDAWCANCGWPWGSHFTPRVATRAASQARTEWSPRVGAPPRSCCASDTNSKVSIGVPKTTKPSGCQASSPNSWTSSGTLLALFHTLVFPWCNLMSGTLANASVSSMCTGTTRSGDTISKRHPGKRTNLSSPEEPTGHDGGLSNASQCLFQNWNWFQCALVDRMCTSLLPVPVFGPFALAMSPLVISSKAHSFATVRDSRAVAVFHDYM